jgi:hypothetical protein
MEDLEDEDGDDSFPETAWPSAPTTSATSADLTQESAEDLVAI